MLFRCNTAESKLRRACLRLFRDTKIARTQKLRIEMRARIPSQQRGDGDGDGLGSIRGCATIGGSFFFFFPPLFPGRDLAMARRAAHTMEMVARSPIDGVVENMRSRIAIANSCTKPKPWAAPYFDAKLCPESPQSSTRSAPVGAARTSSWGWPWTGWDGLGWAEMAWDGPLTHGTNAHGTFAAF